jgi:hypothetical protein
MQNIFQQVNEVFVKGTRESKTGNITQQRGGGGLKVMTPLNGTLSRWDEEKNCGVLMFLVYSDSVYLGLLSRIFIFWYVGMFR